MKVGNRIGRLQGARRRKSHPNYRKSRSLQLPPLHRTVPPRTGFHLLTAQAVYDGMLNVLRVTVTGRRTPGNLGPGLFVQEVYEDWHRHQIANGSARRKAAELLAEVEASRLPERGLYIDQCLPEGADELAFMEKNCSSCRCPYCELALG